jgi:hypothetical protein
LSPEWLFLAQCSGFIDVVVAKHKNNAHFCYDSPQGLTVAKRPHRTALELNRIPKLIYTEYFLQRRKLTVVISCRLPVMQYLL